jgi:hypothetical protein
MSRKPPTVRDRDPEIAKAFEAVEEVAEKLAKLRKRRVPVTADERAVGVASEILWAVNGLLAEYDRCRASGEDVGVVAFGFAPIVGAMVSPAKKMRGRA